MALKIKRNTREVEEIPLSSTADIAFLLIVFFLAASALLELRGVKIPLPKKDAPPMQVLKENLFKIYIQPDGRYTYEKTIIRLEDLSKKMDEAFRKNSELIIAIRVSPEAPANCIPEIVNSIQKLGIGKISIGMEKK